MLTLVETNHARSVSLSLQARPLTFNSRLQHPLALLLRPLQSPFHAVRALRLPELDLPPLLEDAPSEPVTLPFPNSVIPQFADSLKPSFEPSPSPRFAVELSLPLKLSESVLAARDLALHAMVQFPVFPPQAVFQSSTPQSTLQLSPHQTLFADRFALLVAAAIVLPAWLRLHCWPSLL